MNSLFYAVPAASILALLFAFIFYRQMKKEDEGTPTMKQIAQYVREGAMAYLKQQYKVVVIVFAILAVFFAVLAYGFGVQNPWVPFAFLTGGFFSGLAGFIGMKTASFASGRTANACRKSLNGGLKVAFRSGAVMGLTVVGLGLLDIAIWWIILNAFVVEASTAQKLAESSQTGPATIIISGVGLGMRSTAIPVVTIAAAIILSFLFATGFNVDIMAEGVLSKGLYGVAIAAVGMLSTLGITR